MTRNPNRRRRSKSIIRADNFLAWAVPVLFMFLAVHQQITKGEIDKLYIGVLLIFGLAAAGWRIDVFFETYMKAKYGGQNNDPPPAVSVQVSDNDNTGDSGDAG